MIDKGIKSFKMNGREILIKKCPKKIIYQRYYDSNLKVKPFYTQKRLYKDATYHKRISYSGLKENMFKFLY